MAARLIVVTGTGTGIGKTHLTCALLNHGRHRDVVGGFKPIESGVATEAEGDAAALVAASHPTFHVKHPCSPYLLARPVSPHLAAAAEGRSIDLEHVRHMVELARASCDVLFVELAGGLFSPLGLTTTNLELVERLRPDSVLLVAPDRLGVLHDLGAVFRAWGGVTAVALVAPAAPDVSTGTNANEVGIGTPSPARAVAVPRGTVKELASSEVIRTLYASVR